MHAVRNIKLCMKDCLCLYVCPSGATDTETGQIDAEKCLDGCRLCVDACPSHAITLMPENFPKPQKKQESVRKQLISLAVSKSHQEQAALSIKKLAKSDAERKLAGAIAFSDRLMAEDLLREAGYMLPQSKCVLDFLAALKSASKPGDFQYQIIEDLIDMLRKQN